MLPPERADLRSPEDPDNRTCDHLADRINVLGVGVSVLNLRSAADIVLEAIRERREGYICVTGVHGVVEAQNEEAFRRTLNQSLLCTPDGMPLVWIGRHYYRKKEMGRVYGPDLMWAIFEATEGTGATHFFYGGKEGVADLLKAKLQKRFPKSRIVGTYCPPFRPLNDEEERDFIGQVSLQRPDIIWVGLSTPKQERFMAEYLGKVDTKIMLGVGAAFDIHAGLVKKAPDWIQGIGMEWLYRLSQEPKRLWPRYRRIIPRFIILSGRQFIMGTRRAPDAK